MQNEKKKNTQTTTNKLSKQIKQTKLSKTKLSKTKLSKTKLNKQ